jgi:hypothetical protein
MIDLKACTRCGGDMMAEEILGDVDLVCLQCGYRKAMPVAAPVYRAAPRRVRVRLPQRRAA